VAQDAPQSVTVTGRSGANAASVAGFGDIPLSRSPFTATVINASQLNDAGISSLADLTRLDAGTTDAYNAPGYWGMLAVRGYTLDNRFNYRRDGLPINAETAIPDANKQSLEILKGISGVQAGTSAPGGLVNLVVKRPRGTLRDVALGWSEQDNRSIAMDIGDGNTSFGWRVNAAYEHLQPQTFDSRGHRRLLALAVDAQPRPGLLVEAEFEYSHQQQPSTPGFSLLGSRLPDADSIDPRINLNNQPWRLPVVMEGRTGSLRITQALAKDLQFTAHAMRQRLDSNDRVAFPFGCSAENNYDRYCSDGSFDLYDFRSDGERRTSDALDLALSGKAVLAGMTHGFTAGMLSTRFVSRFNGQAYNWVGTGTIDGLTVTPPDPTLYPYNTNRDERSTEWRVQDAIALSEQASAWIGLRQTSLERRSAITDGSQATNYSQSFTTPWLALSHIVGRGGMAYVSWGQGIESEVAPNFNRYTNAGASLPALKSRQFELGYKQRDDMIDWSVAAFDIRRPQSSDFGACTDDAGSCTRAIDGWARHRGVEAEAEWRSGPWSLRGSAMLLQARREDAADSSSNGLRPTNVPASSLKLQGVYNLSALPGLALLGFVTHEGDRMVLPDNSIRTPGWTRTDLAMRYTQRLNASTVVWRAGIDNVTDLRAWKEAPYQYGHAYLYPLAPRAAHLSMQITL
jgi:iron complex outermembrane receptor protein